VFIKLVPCRLAPLIVLLALAAFAPAAVLAGGPAPAGVSIPWPKDRSDLPSDPAITWGRLPNGVRYAVRSSAEPRGRISLCLMVLAGSQMERDDQQGYAHFVEHMAFKGTRHFPAGTLVKTLQRHGMAFGAEVSAFTTFDTTFYNLNLAGNTSESLGEGLQVLRDFADGVEFGQKEIDTERGVILSEWRTRESGPERVWWNRLTTLYDGTLFARRKPIGEVASIERADRAGLLDFYDTWYRPERMVLIAVGDAKPEFLVSQISQFFADMRARRPAVPAPAVGGLATKPGVHPSLFTEMDSGGGTSIEFASVQPGVLSPSRATLRTQLARSVACDILGMRLHEVVTKDPASFGGSSATFSETFGRFTESSAIIESRSGNWMRALVTLEHELRRALQRGFNPSEIALSASTGLAACRYASECAPTRHSDELVATIREDLMSGRVTEDPSAYLALVQPIFNSLTPQECLRAFRSLWPEDQQNILVCGGIKISDPVKEIGEIYDSSRRFPVVEDDEEPSTPFAYTHFGPAGKIAERKHIDDLDMDLIRFANGVRLNLKRTNYVADTVAIRVRFGGGLASEPRNKPGLGFLAGTCFLDSALGRHDSEAINRIIRGNTIALSFSAEDDAFVFTGGTDRAHIQLLFQLITAFFTDPGWRDDALASARGHIGSYYSSLSTDTSAFAAAVGPKFVTDGDPRYGMPRFIDVSKRTLVEVRSWLGPQLASGPVEIGVIGDMDVKKVINLAAETFGTLPPRASRSDLPSRPVHPLQKAGELDMAIQSNNPKATVWIAWVFPGNINATTSRQADLLGDILNDRIRSKIREELGAAYDATVFSWESQADPRFDLLIAQMTTPPGAVRRLASIVRQISSDLARNGVNADEFERARQPILASLEQNMRDNTYWLYYVLGSAQEHPDRLDWPRTRERDYRSMTRDEVNALAKQYLGAERAYSVLVAPKL
jgi:zinc protease